MRQSWCLLYSETARPTKTAAARVAQDVWRSPGFRRLIVGCAIAVLAFLIAPYIIAPFYRVIDPVSTPMLWRWATGARVQRTFVPLRRIAPALPSR